MRLGLNMRYKNDKKISNSSLPDLLFFSNSKCSETCFRRRSPRLPSRLGRELRYPSPLAPSASRTRPLRHRTMVLMAHITQISGYTQISPCLVWYIEPILYFLLNFIVHAYAACEAVILPVYWYVHCNFQQNIALFCAISHFVVLPLFADAQWWSRFFSGTEHWTWGEGRESGGSLSYPQPTKVSGERRNSSTAGSGVEPIRKRFLNVLSFICNFCAILRVLVHFGFWKLAVRNNYTKNTIKYKY